MIELSSKSIFKDWKIPGAFFIVILITMVSILIPNALAKSQKIETVTDENIKFSIQDVSYKNESGKDKITINFIQEINKGELGEIEGGVELYVNGKQINYSSGTSGDKIDKNKYKGSIEAYPTNKLPNKFTLDIKIYQIGERQGEWFFKMPVTKK